MAKRSDKMSIYDTDGIITYTSAAVSERSLFPPSIMFTLSLQRKTELKQKAKRVRGGGSRKGGGMKKGRRRRRRRNSLVKEFKWNDEKKLEGRTG